MLAVISRLGCNVTLVSAAVVIFNGYLIGWVFIGVFTLLDVLADWELERYVRRLERGSRNK